MKSIVLLPFLVLVFLHSNAQSVIHFNKCGTDERELSLLQTEPDAYAWQEEAMRNAMDAMPEAIAARITDPTESCPNGVRIIPIYFHVLHDNGSENFGGDNNFTTSEIQSAVDQLNMHYQGTNPQLSRVQDQFWADGRVSSNTCIQFCWNPTDVNRIDVTTAPHAVSLFDSSGVIMPRIRDHRDAVSSPYQNKCQYLNIYTGRYGLNQFSNGGLLGYAWNIFSSSAGVRIDDNIFVPNGPITNVGDTRGVTMAHEVGHYLGLPHIWGQSNIDNWNTLTAATFCGIDDGFADTPNQARPASGPGGVAGGVPIYTQNYVMAHCGNTIMWTNIMDYSNNAWTVNFTEDQVDFMNLYLTQAENLLPSQPANCDTTGGFLNGETKCTGLAIGCDAGPINPSVDTIRVCGTDTINLNTYLQTWNWIAGKSPATEYTWRRGSLSGSLVDFPAKTIVSGNSPVCTPDTLNYFLNMKCTTSGAEEEAGKVVVLSYLTPEQLLARYLRDGDCENGPGPVYSMADSLADCHNLMSFIGQTSPTFPTTVSGEIVYDVAFDSLIVGPCCNFPCTATDTAEYRCEFTGGDCDGVAWSGGSMFVLSPCPDLDFDDTFDGYETNLVSIFDPNGYINDIYYYSDPERHTTWDEVTDYYYDGDGCNFGSDIPIYTSMGCDTDNNGIPNGYIALGTITLSSPMPAPSAPTIEYSLNGDMDCVYEAVPHCWDDDITPSIPIEVCGASDLDDITFSVLSGAGCVEEHTVAKPDCPDCGPPGGCVSTTWPGGSESVCSGGYLADGFPILDLSGPSDPLNDVFWMNGPYGEPWAQSYSNEPYDNPNYLGPQIMTDPSTGLPGIQIYFAYSVCDDDADPETPPVVIPLGEYEVTVEPTPNGLITPVCLGSDSLNFYVEVELFTNAQANTFTATNSYNAGTLSFTDPGTQLLGPFPNGTDVTIDFAIDGGCSSNQTFNTGCLNSSCTTPEILYADTCVLNPNTNAVEYFVVASITGGTTSFLVELTNDLNDDTAYVSMQQPTIALGPFATSQTITYTATDYANAYCSESTTIEFDICTLIGVSEVDPIDVRVYPNPADEIVNFSFESGLNGEQIGLNVYDVLGQVVLKSNSSISNNRIELDVRSLESGLYLAEINSETKRLFRVIRFVKE